MKDADRRTDITKHRRRLLMLTLVVIGLVVLEISGYLHSMNRKMSGVQKEDVKRIGVVYMTMNNPFYSVIDNQLQLRVDSEGDKLLTRDSAMDQEQQNMQIENLLKNHIDLLVVNPVSSEGVIPAVKKAVQLGIPVVVIDAPLKDSSLAACTIHSDNYDAGVQCAEDLMQRLKSGKILLLEHSAVESASERVRGFIDVLDDHPEYQIIGRGETQGQLELAMPETEKLIQTYGVPDVIMALNDPSALGALEALEKEDLLGKVLVYGVDGTPEAKALIQNGTMTGTSAQQVYQMGKMLGTAVYNILDGKEVRKEIIVPVKMITSDNVNEYNIDGWQ